MNWTREEEMFEVKDYSLSLNGSVVVDYTQENQDLFTPPTTLSSKHTNHRLVVLYVIGIFLLVVILLAVGYLVKLNYKSLLPSSRKNFCDFRDCFRKCLWKRRTFFQRRTKNSNFTIPQVVVSDENGECMEPEADFDSSFP